MARVHGRLECRRKLRHSDAVSVNRSHLPNATSAASLSRDSQGYAHPTTTLLWVRTLRIASNGSCRPLLGGIQARLDSSPSLVLSSSAFPGVTARVHCVFPYHELLIGRTRRNHTRYGLRRLPQNTPKNVCTLSSPERALRR